MPAAGAAGAGPSAGDRAFGGVPRPGGGPLRRAARGVAFRRDHDGAAPRLAYGRRGPRADGGWRALCLVPAVPAAWADRRRRGTRHFLQAGGRRPLQRAGHGGAAGLHPRRAGGACLRDAQPRKLGQCGCGQVPAAGPDLALRRGGAAGDAHHRHAAAGGALEPLDLARAGRGGECADGAGRTGAFVPQPPGLCAGDALPGLRAADRLRPLRCADGGAPLPQAAGLPPVRRDEAHAGGLPVLRRGGQAGRGRPRCRTAG